MSIPVLISPVLNRFDLLGKMLRSIDHPIGKIVLIDNGDIIPDDIVEHPALRIIRPGHNLGVSASWNLGMKVTPQAAWWLIVGSDVTFGPGDLAKLDELVVPDSDAHYFLDGMSCFAITAVTLSAVGYFDENFHPAYDEDLDWHRRALLVGSERVNPPFTGTHVGSATIRSDPLLRAQNGPTHGANDAYYARKWGGAKLGSETFSTPFNRGGHVGDWRLEPERLAAQSWRRR